MIGERKKEDDADDDAWGSAVGSGGGLRRGGVDPNGNGWLAFKPKQDIALLRCTFHYSGCLPSFDSLFPFRF